MDVTTDRPRRAGRASRWTMFAGALAAAALLAGPVSATPATLKRSVENLTQWPLDMAASPVTSGVSIYRNMQDVGDSTAVRVAYPVPGYAWNLMVNIGASVLRGVTGVIEFVPGMVLLFTPADMEPLFDPPAENDGLVKFENGIYDVNFGIDYTTPGG
jgi:hypothetical protein